LVSVGGFFVVERRERKENGGYEEKTWEEKETERKSSKIEKS